MNGTAEAAPLVLQLNLPWDLEVFCRIPGGSSTLFKHYSRVYKTTRVGTGKEKKCHSSPEVSLQSTAPRWRAGSPARLVIVNSVPPRWSPALCPSRGHFPRHPREKQHPGGTEAAATARSALRDNPPPACAPSGQGRTGLPARIAGPPRTGPATGGSAVRGGAGRRRARVAAAAAAAQPRPAALPGGGRLAGRGDGEQEHGLSPGLSPAASRPPLPGSSEATTDPAARLPRLTEARRDALPPPDACSPRPAARAVVAFLEKLGRGRERKGGGKGEGRD